eukprot:1180152-Prorocentrum_minimum.AAC.2
MRVHRLIGWVRVSLANLVVGWLLSGGMVWELDSVESRLVRVWWGRTSATSLPATTAAVYVSRRRSALSGSSVFLRLSWYSLRGYVTHSCHRISSRKTPRCTDLQHRAARGNDSARGLSRYGASRAHRKRGRKAATPTCRTRWRWKQRWH